MSSKSINAGLNMKYPKITRFQELLIFNGEKGRKRSFLFFIHEYVIFENDKLHKDMLKNKPELMKWIGCSYVLEK